MMLYFTVGKLSLTLTLISNFNFYDIYIPFLLLYLSIPKPKV